MIDPEVRVQIRRYFYAEHWKIGTIAQALGASSRHGEARHRSGALSSRRAVARHDARSLSSLCAPDAGSASAPLRHATASDAARSRLPRKHRATAARGGAFAPTAARGVSALAGLRRRAGTSGLGALRHGHDRPRKADSVLLRDDLVLVAGVVSGVLLRSDDGELPARPCACVSLVFRRGKSRLYDNLKSAVLERHGSQIHFNPRLLELAGHYHFVPRPCQVRAGNQKGRVERAIRYVRDSFWAARGFTTLEECNRQALKWRDEVAHQRPWPDDRNRTVAEAFIDEQPRLLPLAAASVQRPNAWSRCARPRLSMCASTATTTRFRPRLSAVR